MRLTRRGLAAALLALAPQPSAAFTVEPDPIHATIEGHREAVRNEARAVAAVERAKLLDAGRLADLVAERKRLRKLRHNKRRELRRATPTTAAGWAALIAYYRGLVPSPDPSDVAGIYRADLAAARARAVSMAG